MEQRTMYTAVLNFKCVAPPPLSPAPWCNGMEWRGMAWHGRDEVAQTLNVLLALKRWIRVQVPKIEDGNNFGVSVQLDVAKGIGELTTPVASSLGVCACQVTVSPVRSVQD